MKEKESSLTEIVLAAAATVAIYGSALGYEANMTMSRVFNPTKIEDSSFSMYVENAKKQYNNNVGAYTMAIWTYPGAKLASVVNNIDTSEK